MTSRRMLNASVLALGAALVLTQAAAAQAGVLHGVVMGGTGPVANLDVALHRVMPDGSGDMLDQTVTDSAGRFQFSVTLSGDSAVYFAATRIEDNLFVGPPIKGELPSGEYVIDVGPNAQAIPMGNVASAPGAGQLPTGPEAGADAGGGYGYGWVGLLAIVLVGAVIGIMTWSRRPHLSALERQRSRLVRLAALEEDYAGRSDTLDAAQRADYEAKRNAVRDELLGR